MIDVKCDKGAVTLKLTGDVFDLSADILTIMNSVYKGICEENETMGEIFKLCVLKEVSSVFSDNLCGGEEND